MTTDQHTLRFLHNNFFQEFQAVSWHSVRHYPLPHSLRHKALKAVCDGNADALEKCIDEGWPVDAPIDRRGRFSALTLACHLDKLELVHLCDLKGGNINEGVGKESTTPLMAAVGRWNVRIVDYLIERGVDPTVIDSYGFTAHRRAEIKNLRTIASMIRKHEDEFASGKFDKGTCSMFRANEAITNKRWREIVDKNQIDASQYRLLKLWRRDNERIAKFRPSQVMSRSGEYPFRSFDENQDIFCLFSGLSGNNEYVKSGDRPDML